MGTRTKQYVSGVASIAAAASVVSCISQMIPYGLAGDTGKVTFWFVLMLAAAIVGCVAAVAYYYFRSRMIADADDSVTIAVQTLARSAEAPQTPPHPTPTATAEKSVNHQ